MIKLHIKGRVEFGILDGSVVQADSIGSGIRLEFHEAAGLEMRAGKPPTKTQGDDDENEFYD